MPIYEYQCESCGHELEALQKVSDERLVYCPECGEATLRKLVSAAAFRLKGTGWYETDFKNQGKGEKKTESTDNESESKDTKTESKDTKTESKDTKTESKDSKTDGKNSESKDTSSKAKPVKSESPKNAPAS